MTPEPLQSEFSVKRKHSSSPCYQHTGKAVKLNHSGALPRYVISIAVDEIKAKQPDSDRKTAIRFSRASLVSGRLVSEQMVALKHCNTTDVNDVWQFVYGHTKPRHTVWLIGEGILPQLILCGLPHRFTCGELSIDKPRSPRKQDGTNADQKAKQALAVLENPPTIIGCRVGQTQGRLVIVDLLNWFPQGISAGASAEEFTTTSDDVAFPESNGNRRSAAKRAIIAHNDFATLIRWVSENDMGLFRYTASAQAMGAYRHRFMEDRIYVHDNQSVQKQERRSYFGGRSEVFRSGVINEPVYQLDANALFPSVMQSGWFPHLLSRYEHREVLLSLLPAIDWSASCADVEICTDRPVFPVRTDLHIIYPIGTFRTTLCGAELEYAYRTGCIRKCASWSEYKLAPLFNKWVTELWAMRQAYKESGNLLYEQFTKRIMNSLYGKFAQLTPAWENVPTDNSMLPFTTEARLDHGTNTWTQYRSVGWQTQKLCERKEKESSFYAIAAFVTAAARRKMDWFRAIANRKCTLYQGVDSLIVTRAGYVNLLNSGEIVPGRLGKLRLEHAATTGQIRGISDYELGDKICVSSRAKYFDTNTLGDVTQYRTYIMEHLFKNGPIDTIEQRAEDWTRNATYHKGVIGQDGWVEPFELGGNPISASDGSSPDCEADSNRSIVTA